MDWAMWQYGILILVDFKHQSSEDYFGGRGLVGFDKNKYEISQLKVDMSGHIR